MNSVSTNVNDVRVLEFDFIPESDSISIQYVFASNEYYEDACTEYNDIVGFFLSGPGINGPFTNEAINIALVPDPNNLGEYTDTPVSVNTINSGSTVDFGTSLNCENIDPNWQDYSVFFMENLGEAFFSGYTIPLMAKSEVIPNESYHMKIAISNVKDNWSQSAVFIGQGSFSSVIYGCSDSLACNYNIDTQVDNGSCEYAEEYYDCSSDCINDSDLDGVCDELEYSGCTDIFATNYNNEATDLDNSCEYAMDGNCDYPLPFIGNTGANMTLFLSSGFMSSLPLLVDSAYIVSIANNGGLVVGSTNVYGLMETSMTLWGDDAQTSIIDGAEYNEALSFILVNGGDLYNLNIEFDVGSNLYFTNSICSATGVSYGLYCSSSFIGGCTDSEAFNFNELANVDNGSCMYEVDVNFTLPSTSTLYNSIYNLDVDSLLLTNNPIENGDLIGAFYLVDGELICAGYSVYEGINPIEVLLIGDDPLTDIVEGLLDGQEIIWIVQDADTGLNALVQKPSDLADFVPSSNISLNLVEYNQQLIIGCLDEEACNYNNLANLEDGSCVYPLEGLDCDGNCINDFDMDGECDEWDYDDGLGIDEQETQARKLISVVDVLGREKFSIRKGAVLFYIYDNGQVEKRMILEE